jgi:glycosyltransferase involved in cell wall biosynthesis
MNPNLNLLYVHGGWLGYGRVGVKLALELDKMGVDVYDHLAGSEAHYSDGAFVPPQMQKEWDSSKPYDGSIVKAGRKEGRSNIVCWISVPSHGTGWFKGQIPCVFTMWESVTLPEQFRESIHEFETVIVPSMQNVELFSQYHDNVKYVPLGIDPDDWHYQPRPEIRHEFRFLIGGSGSRKGGDLAVKAFKKLWPRGHHFGSGPIATLTHKSPKGEVHYGERIQTVGGYMSPEDEIALYASAHCYLQPSRGEGFGLQPLQAIAQGLPTILTNAHGHEGFAHLGIPLSWEACQSDYFIFGDAGDWWEPNFDELCDLMLDVYENYEPHVERAKEASRVALTQWTWEVTAHKFLDALGRERLELPYTGNNEWYTVEAKKYKVICHQDHYCEIAGAQLQFLKGKEYWQSADIKRILFEAGKLDPSCIDGDAGLTPEQVERLGKYRAEHETCHQCGQSLKPVNA